MKLVPKVALLVETSNSYARELLLGIRAWVRENQPWELRLTEQGRGAGVPRWLQDWDGHGVIARVENARTAATLQRIGLPVVDVSAALARPVFPRVATDANHTADLAFRHLSECGLHHFAYCGDRRFDWARRRGAAFASIARTAGSSCATFSPSPGPVDREIAEIATWLKALPLPVGVFACLDRRGQQVLAACRTARLTVPDEVAVLGVHNDELLCELCDPPLSSVIPNAQHAGYTAAAILCRAIQGEVQPAIVHTIPALGVAARQSTDLAAVGDPKIGAAIRFMRAHSDGPISVSTVLQAVPMARTAFERRFRLVIGKTPHAHLLSLKIARVQHLLASTSLTVGEISARCGIEHPEYLSAMFKRECGLSPRQYRAKFQVHRER